MHGKSGIVSSEPLGGLLSPVLEQALRGLMSIRSFPKGSILFQQGTPAAGIYLLESGTVRVLIPTSQNQNQLLEVAGTGALLGLSENMGGESHRVTVEAEEETTAAFLAREDFLDFLGKNPEFCLQVVRLLSDNLHTLYHKFRGISAHPGRPRRRPLNQQLN